MLKRQRGDRLEMLPRAVQAVAELWFTRLLVILGKRCKELTAERMVQEDLLARFGLKGLGEAGLKDLGCIRRALEGCLAELEEDPPVLPSRGVLTGNLQRLGTLVGLDDTEREILAFLLLGPQFSVLERFLDLLGCVTGTGFHHILAAALKRPLAQVRRALAANGRLSRSGLVHLDLANRYSYENKFELMPGLYERLACAQRQPFGLFANSFVPAPAGRLKPEDYAHLREDLAILRPYLQEALRLRRKGVNVLLHGRPGGGKTQFARMLAADLGCALFEVASATESREPIGGERRFRSYNLSQTILRDMGDALLLFDEVEDVFRQVVMEDDNPGRSNRSGIKAWVNRTLEENPVPAFWVTNQLWVVDPAFRRRFDYVIELEVPPRSVRNRVLEGYLEGLPVDPAWTATMAEHQDLVPALVERSAAVVRLARAGDPALDVAAAMPRALGNALEAMGSTREARGVLPCPTRYRPEILNTDCDLVAMIPGLARAGAGRLCLYGPPGTGKTAFGHHLATELDRPLLARRASDLLGSYLGETERNLAKMFAEARQERAVLLLDEADGFLQDRRNVKNNWEIPIINEMLTQMEGFPGLFVASTNLLDTLEPAALRRFDVKVRFDYLRREQALVMFEDLAASQGLPVDGPARSTLGGMGLLTPGDFAAVANQLRFRPAATAMELAERLRAECSVKPEGRRKTIGFPGTQHRPA